MDCPSAIRLLLETGRKTQLLRLGRGDRRPGDKTDDDGLK
jgi:hypothetical protein